MNPDSLKTFLTIVDKGSFSLAASLLRLTQPAVSRRIAQLESELGTTLLDRVGRSVTLTPAGRALVPQARRILEEIDQTKRSIQGLSDSVSGTLSLATNHHMGLWRLPQLLKLFRQNYPQVSLDLHFMDSEPAHDMILRGEMELGLVTMAPKSHSQLKSIPVWKDPLVFVYSATCSDEDPLASQQKISLSLLSDHPAVLPDVSTFTGRIIREIFAKAKLSLNINTSTNYLETLKMLTSIGIGWSLIPKTMVDSTVRELKVTSPATRTLGFVHHQHKTLSSASRAFIDLALSRSELYDATGDP